MSTHVGPVGLPIDGRERAAREGWTRPVRSPATGEPLWDLPDAGPADADDAVEAAWRAVHATGWSTDGAMRVKALLGFQEALVAESDRLAELLATETGVPIALRETYVDAPVAALRTGPGRANPKVTAVITPATSPIAVALDEIGRTLVAGGAVVLKPAPEAARAAIEIGRIGLDFLPRGVLNVVATRDVDVAIGLTTDRRVDDVSFTGSAIVAERVKDAATHARKRVRVDTGAPQMIRARDNRDLAEVVARAAVTVATNAGQACRIPTSVVVPAFRFMEAREAAKEAMAAVAVGDPLDPATVCGPLRSPVARDRVLRYVALAQSEGADIAAGGHALDRGGWWVAPTVIGGVSRDSRLVTEEVLGPVLMLVADSRRGASARA
ncbi:aldehyde dehydrogenase (NAD+) [Nocardioides sp. BE266]|uniref:aldehyde dehydrogenase family protein n=1 Tax=Nocardioides sp. BE266 TaxID=2817725 RepID=UPI002863C19E|nr:aldehyde dehydrogenase family protein [Nocardioides sp. BE266]MDR7254837.1 aldehyde dehydrogenase (NAD+) [Nocardioides sp. BE266]